MSTPNPKGSITLNLDTNKIEVKYVKLIFLIEMEDLVAYYDMQGGRRDTSQCWPEKSSSGRDGAPSAIILGFFGSHSTPLERTIDDLLPRIRGHREHLVTAVPTSSVRQEMTREQRKRRNKGR
jgi:hypothetical protein